jgi:hypothetical protein
MSYSSFYKENNTVHIGEIFDDFFDAIHYTIKFKEKHPSYEHMVVNTETSKVVCVLRSI